MFINVLFGLLIFSYSAWALTRYVQKTKQGKCAACSLSDGCSKKVCNGPVKFTPDSSASTAHTL